MAATKRTRLEEETESDVKSVKKEAARVEDRLSDLPKVLQVRILACLDQKQAVQTSVLSKTWVSLWTHIPILEFNYFSVNDFFLFDNFVMNTLHRRDHCTLDTLKFNGHGSCRTEVLKSAFDYAFSHDVKHLEASIHTPKNYSWPVSQCDSLTTLKLETEECGILECPFLGPRFILFKNLAVLYLKRACITDVEAFSGFPVLESLSLVDCLLWTKVNEDKILRVHALRLSDLTISHITGVKCVELKTPRLRFLKYQGSNFLRHDGLPVLETMEIDLNGFSHISAVREREEQLIDHLNSLLWTIPNVQSLKVYCATFLLLSMFPDELVNIGSPFRKLKDLTLDVSDYDCPKMFHRPANGALERVKGYLLNNSPHAKYTITYPKDKFPWFSQLLQ